MSEDKLDLKGEIEKYIAEMKRYDEEYKRAIVSSSKFAITSTCIFRSPECEWWPDTHQADHSDPLLMIPIVHPDVCCAHDENHLLSEIVQEGKCAKCVTGEGWHAGCGVKD